MNVLDEYRDHAGRMCESVKFALAHIDPSDVHERVLAFPEEEAQMGAPRLVLAELVWEIIEEEGVADLVRWKKVTGTFATQAHTWYEMRFIDHTTDPLPQVFIIDPAPVGAMHPFLCWEPGCAFQMLYRRPPTRERPAA